MSSDSPQSGGPPSSSSRPLPIRPVPSHLMTRSAFASFTSPSLTSTASEPTPQSSGKRHRFNVERIYEFEAPQFYDFTKQSDPERGHLDEHWFDSRKRTPSSPDFNFMARSSTSNRPKSTSGKINHKGNFSGSIGGLSFMNTPIGRGQTFQIPSSVGPLDFRSSASFQPRAALKKSATAENVANSILMNSDSSDPPSTIIRSAQKKFKEFGSDERKIISGFLSTPLLVIKTPAGGITSLKKDLPRSPLQKVTTKKSKLGLFASEGSSLLARETSSMEETLSFMYNETNFIEETFKESALSSTDYSVPNSSILSSMSCSGLISSRPSANTSIKSVAASIKEHESFQASVNARIHEERERIEVQAAAQAKKLQKIKAGPTILPVKSTKPLTIPKGFHLKCDERAQLKKSNNSHDSSSKAPMKVSKPSTAHKFVPTVPKSPLFASKLRAAAKCADTSPKSNIPANKENNNPNTRNDLRRKLEFKPMAKNSLATTIPQSPKLSSIHRNRLVNKSNK